MHSRRDFVKSLGAGTLALSSFSPSLWAHDLHTHAAKYADTDVQNNEDYWRFIQQAYTVNPNIINLNNGGVSPQPKVVQDALERYNRISNEGPSYYMWRILDQGREPLREKLALLAGCDADEIAINRNATEALNTVVYGIDLKPGDEVVLSRQDYPNMIQAWKQRELRDKIKLVWLNFDFPIEDEQFIADQFINAFNNKTKVVHITHMINWVGQIMPVSLIAKAARARGIKVLVDGAHSFGLLDFKIPDLHCDYFGSSLHKFLSAPFGSGILYIKKDNIKKCVAFAV